MYVIFEPRPGVASHFDDGRLAPAQSSSHMAIRRGKKPRNEEERFCQTTHAHKKRRQLDMENPRNSELAYGLPSHVVCTLHAWGLPRSSDIPISGLTITASGR